MLEAFAASRALREASSAAPARASASANCFSSRAIIEAGSSPATATSSGALLQTCTSAGVLTGVFCGVARARSAGCIREGVSALTRPVSDARRLAARPPLTAPTRKALRPSVRSLKVDSRRARPGVRLLSGLADLGAWSSSAAGPVGRRGSGWMSEFFAGAGLGAEPPFLGPSDALSCSGSSAIEAKRS